MRKNTAGIVQFVLVVIILLAIPVGLFLVKKFSFLFSKATAPTARMYLATTSLFNQSGDVNVKIDSPVSVGFVQATITFNNAKLQLSQEVAPSAVFKTVVSKTSMQEANATGKITLVLGLAPEDKPNAPIGIFDVATLPFTVISTVSNDPTTLSIDPATSQIVDLSVQELLLQTENLVVSLHPTAASPSPTPVATKTPRPTKAPRPAKTPRPR